uniref:Uncharacterized protein n=1 Tax=Ditylenchus dipsaci TaxID=166011 RepID=A0A915E8S2_9BILA
MTLLVQCTKHLSEELFSNLWRQHQFCEGVFGVIPNGSTNQSPTSPLSDTWPGEQQRGMPDQSSQIRFLRIHIQRSNNNSSRPLQQDQQQSTTCGSNRLTKPLLHLTEVFPETLNEHVNAPSQRPTSPPTSAPLRTNVQSSYNRHSLRAQSQNTSIQPGALRALRLSTIYVSSNMVNPFMTPPPFWQYPQFGMAPALHPSTSPTTSSG